MFYYCHYHHRYHYPYHQFIINILCCAPSVIVGGAIQLTVYNLHYIDKHFACSLMVKSLSVVVVK